LRTRQIAKIEKTSIKAIDPDINKILLAKEIGKNKNIEYLVAKAEKLPFISKQFDIVVFTLSLHHIKNIKEAIKEACRVIKDSGKIIVIEPGFEGTIFQAEIDFACFDGDERNKKITAYQLILQSTKIKELDEFWGKTKWIFNSEVDFKKNMLPSKNLSQISKFLSKNNFNLWGERRINVFKKISN